MKGDAARSRRDLEAELRACAADINWRVWNGAERVLNRKTRQYEMADVWKFYGGTGLVATRAGLLPSLRFVRTQAHKAFEARKQKRLGAAFA